CAGEVTLVPADRPAAVPRLPAHLRQLFYLRRVEGQHARAGARWRRQGDTRAVCRGRNGGLVPPGLYRGDVRTARCRIRAYRGAASGRNGLIPRPRPVPVQSKIVVARSRRGVTIEILHSTEPDSAFTGAVRPNRGPFGSDEPITQALMIP